MRFINYNLRGGASSQGSISADKLYGIDGMAEVRESSPTRADSFSDIGEGAAPGAVNMIAKGTGTLTKRPGFIRAAAEGAPNAIDSVHIHRSFNGDTVFYLNSSTVTRVTDEGYVYSYTVSFDTANCRSVQAGEYMFFFNGRGLIIINAVDGKFMYWGAGGNGGSIDDTYLPTLYIANTPSGAGAAYEAVNLLNSHVAEQYQGDGSSKEFMTHLEGDDFEVFTKAQDGSWKKTEIATYSKNSVELISAPQKPDITGEDNVRIVYRYKNSELSPHKIYGCTCGTVFGVEGNLDRVFLSGNTSFPGQVFYSHMDEPLYFADLDYIKVGDNETDVFALAPVGTGLAVIADGSIYTVYGGEGQTAAIKQDALFLVGAAYPTPEPVSANTLMFMGEPVYLTKSGVCAITPSGILDERCAELRSERLDAHLLKSDLRDMRMAVYDRYLVLSDRKGTLYLLDGKQYTAPRRYEGFIWKGIHAKDLWVTDEKLYFTDGSAVFVFTSGERAQDFCDEQADGTLTPIDAYWETPYLYPSDLKDYKFFSKLGVLTDSDTDHDGREMNSDIKISACFDNDDWRVIRDYSGYLSLFRYASIDYGSFTYRDRAKNYALYTRLHHKKGRGIKLRFENGKLRRPLTLVRFCADYMKM